MEGYEKFKAQVLKLIGLDLTLYKERQMKRRIESLIKRNGMASFDAYYTLLTKDKGVFDEFINYLTINVSEFYRNPQQWDILKTEIIPEIIKRNPRPKIWSAACSTGEEPYTIAMVMSQFVPLKDLKIIAADIDLEAMNKAKMGIYSKKSIVNVPETYKTKYFTPIGESYKINDEVKQCIEFKQMNLLKDQYPTGMDLIVCRNVMIYFTEEAKDEMYHKFNKALGSNGTLFVGSTEQIIVPQRYNFKASKTFFYQKQ